MNTKLFNLAFDQTCKMFCKKHQNSELLINGERQKKKKKKGKRDIFNRFNKKKGKQRKNFLMKIIPYSGGGKELF